MTELERGWYVAWGDESGGSPDKFIPGSHGLVVNKETGRIFVLGSAFPLERDLRMYDRGMDADRHDVVILWIANLDKTVAFLQRLEPIVVEMSYDHGTVWRIPRRRTEDELRGRLANLPAIFPDLGPYFCFEAVEEARSIGCCGMDLLPRVGQTPIGELDA
jgi:hypothetical protein